MSSKPRRDLRASSATAKALWRLATALCLVALLAGAVYLQAARTARHDVAAPGIAPAIGTVEKSPPAAPAAAPSADHATSPAIASQQPKAGMRPRALAIFKRISLPHRSLMPAAVARDAKAQVGMLNPQHPVAKVEVAPAESDHLPLRLMTPAATPFDVTRRAAAETTKPSSLAEVAPPSTAEKRLIAAPEAIADAESKESHAGSGGGRRMHPASGAQEATPTAPREPVAAQGTGASGPELVQMVGPVSQDLDLRQLPNIPGNGEEDEVRRTRHPMVPNPQAKGIDDPEQPVKPQEVSSMPAMSVSFDGISR